MVSILVCDLIRRETKLTFKYDFDSILLFDIFSYEVRMQLKVKHMYNIVKHLLVIKN